MSIVDSVLKQAERVQVENSFSLSKEERMKKYFTPYLSQDERNGIRRVRILPTSDGTSPFVEAYFHEIKVGKKYIKIYDPGMNDGERSPLTEVHDRLLSTGKAQDKKYANNYKSRLYYIVKVIDRDNPQDGVKFWRIKHHYKGDGPFDKIITVLKTKGDIFDVVNGRDLLIQLSKQRSNNGKDYTAIQSILYDDVSLLSDDDEQVKSWLEDTLTWRDVYSRKPVEYLEAVSQGKVPKWDPVSEDYIFEDPDADEFEFGGTKGGSKSDNYSEDDYDDEELPF